MTLLRMASHLAGILTLTFSTWLHAQPASAKIEVCRHPTIVEGTDKSKVAIQGPVYFKPPRDSYLGTSDIWIEVAKDFTIGPKPACLTLTGALTRNEKNAPNPKAGTLWQATAYAAPDQYIGKKPVERIIEVDGIKGMTLEGSGVEIKEITLRGRLLQDLK